MEAAPPWHGFLTRAKRRWSREKRFNTDEKMSALLPEKIASLLLLKNDSFFFGDGFTHGLKTRATGQGLGVGTAVRDDHGAGDGGRMMAVASCRAPAA